MAKLELTEREKAIARGDDPNAVTTAAEIETPAEESTAENSAGGGEQITSDDLAPSAGASSDDAGKDARSLEGTAGGKDAANLTEGHWLDSDADTKTLGQSYGLNDEDLRTFKSADELRRAAQLWDRQLSRPNQPAPAGSQPAPAAAVSTPPELDLDVKKYEEAGYDEDTINLVKYTQALKGQLEAVKKQAADAHAHTQEQIRRQNAAAFHDVVDTLNEPLFGRVTKNGQRVDLPKNLDDNRLKLKDAAETLATGIVTRATQAGQKPDFPPIRILLERAANLVFANELREQERAKLTSKLQQQSKTRRPVGGSRPTQRAAEKKPDGGYRDEAKQVADDPAIVKMWNQFQEANGHN